MNFNAESITKRANAILRSVQRETVEAGDAAEADVASWRWTGRAFTQMSVEDGQLKTRIWVEIDSSDSFHYTAWYAWARDMESSSVVDIAESLDEIQ